MPPRADLGHELGKSGLPSANNLIKCYQSLKEDDILKTHLALCTVLIMALLAYPAWAGCGKWVVRDNTDFLTDPLFDQAVASSTGSSATLNPDGTAKQSTEKEKENTGVTSTVSSAATVEKKDPAIDLGGTWKVMLEKGTPDQNKGIALDLILIQTGERLQGYGTLIDEGSDIPATATGSISEGSVSLDVKLVKQKKDYKLDMALVNNKMEGNYELYESEKLAEDGNATASRSAF
jgi:hypothetical protein